MITNNKGLAIASMWSKPQFTDLNGLIDRANLLETVHSEDVYRIKNKAGEEWPKVPKRQHIVGNETDEVYSIPTTDYTIVQHIEAMEPMITAIRESGVNVSGTILENGDGTLYGFLVLGESIWIAGEEFKHCIEIHNSYNCALSFVGNGALMRVKCKNGMIQFVGTMAKVGQRHTKGVSEAVLEWKAMLSKNMIDVDLIEKTIYDNLAKTVKKEEIEEILFAIGIGKRDVEKIMQDYDMLCPDITQYGLCGWTLFNVVTAYYSHRTKASIKRNRDFIISANRILTSEIAILYKEGRRIIEAMAEKN